MFCSCLQGVAAIKWYLCTVNDKGDKCTEKNFTNYIMIMDYLEAVAKCTNLDNQVICWLHLKAKPGHMLFEVFFNPQTHILTYCKKDCLHHCLELPSNAELYEQVFLAQPIAHQGKYAEKHHVIETDMLKLREFFEGCQLLMFGMANTKGLSRSKRESRKKQRPRKEAVATTNTITQGNMAIKTAISPGPMIDALRTIIKEMIMIPQAMNSMNMTATVTRTIFVIMFEDTPRTRTMTRTIRTAAIMPHHVTDGDEKKSRASCSPSIDSMREVKGSTLDCPADFILPVTLPVTRNTTAMCKKET